MIHQSDSVLKIENQINKINKQVQSMIIKSFHHVSMSFDNVQFNGAVAMTTNKHLIIDNH